MAGPLKFPATEYFKFATADLHPAFYKTFGKKIKRTTPLKFIGLDELDISEKLIHLEDRLGAKKHESLFPSSFQPTTVEDIEKYLNETRPGWHKLAFMSPSNTTVAQGLKAPKQTRAAMPSAAPISAPVISKMPS